jgi:OmpA-OmpF porin, OOP family
MHVPQILVAAAPFLCVSGLLLPARATAEPAPTPARERATIARKEAGFARDSAAVEARRAALGEQKAALARNEAERATTPPERSSGAEQELADLKAQETEPRLVLTLGDVLFASDEAKLAADARRKLDPLVTRLKAQRQRHIRVAGYADSSGAEVTNLELSQRRADAVRDFLVANGINPDRITARGYGEANPVGSNATAAGRKDNRRVEVLAPRVRK